MTDRIVEKIREHFGEQIFVAHDLEIRKRFGPKRLHNPPQLARLLLRGLKGSSEQLMVSGGRSAHQSDLGPVCPLLIHREERRLLLGDDKETIWSD